MGVHTCLLTNLRGENPTFCRSSDPTLTLWTPPFHNAGKIRKSRTVASICGYMWARPHQTWWGPPTHLWDRLSHWCGSGASKFWIDITSAVSQLASPCLILGVGFRGQAIRWRHSRDRGSKGCCHGNLFWDYTSCTWPVMGDNYMRVRIKDGLFSVNPYVCWSLSLVS